ncbi:alpha/beta fold hydrolase [Alteromonadaceae bacterium M269]|nr:alpha/beta fold hydrolase [Alteromonadaceae bacterium M269]
MEYLRTPDSQFTDLEGFSFSPNYLHVDDNEGGQLRVHYLDEGPKDGQVVLLLHGEPSWCYLYRKTIPTLIEHGFRVIAPDLVGFGRSDKPTKRTDYTYIRHLNWLKSTVKQLNLSNVTLVCQDWGGLLGLRMVAEDPEQYARVLATNTFLPTGDIEPNDAFLNWKKFSQEVPSFPASGIIKGATVNKLTPEIIAAYDAPFPDESYKEGARQFPVLVPISPDNVEAEANREAWKKLATFNKPFLTAFSDSDPVTAGGDAYMQRVITGCEGQKHTTIVAGGHFVQEDKGEELAQITVQFIKDNPLQ